MSYLIKSAFFRQYPIAINLRIQNCPKTTKLAFLDTINNVRYVNFICILYTIFLFKYKAVETGVLQPLENY